MKIGIIGTGLIGGSLALALKNSGKKYEIFCWNRKKETSLKAVKLKAVDNHFESIEELTKNSDVIIIATPLSTYPIILKEISKKMDSKKIISDVGSVKNEPVKKALKMLPEKFHKNFIPAHPIAGKEIGGIENAESDLFKSKKIILAKRSEIIEKIWKDAGAKIEILNSSKHDEIYAYVSHYIQFLSFILAKIFPHNMGEFSRLMKSPPELWQDIFELNKVNINKVHSLYVKSFLRNLKYINSFKGRNEFEIAAKIIASSYVEMVPVKYRKYGGSGYKSFTSILSDSISNPGKVDIEKVSKILTRVFDELKKERL